MIGAGASTGLVGSARALRHGGVGCGPERVQAPVAAVDHLDLAERDQVCRPGRLALRAEPDDLPRYDAAFTASGTMKPQGETIKVFLDRWGRRGAARRAVVVICPDGGERGDPAPLAEQARRLKHLAHKVVLVNPHAGHGHLPARSGIAALPHPDRLLAGHGLDTPHALLEEVRLA